MAVELTKRAALWWSNTRQDSEALFELRQLFFGIIIVVAVTYGFYVFHVEAKGFVKQENISHKKELIASLGGTELTRLTTLHLQKLGKTKIALQEKLELLQFKESILREQYETTDNSEPFANVIFTLLPISPVDIENGFVQMNVLDSRSYEYFQIHPLNFQGKTEYTNFMFYLQYLEQRHEVGMIGNISLELLASTPFGDESEVQFDIELGRIQLLPVN